MFINNYYYEKMAEFKEKEIQKQIKDVWRYKETVVSSSINYKSKISKLLRSRSSIQDKPCIDCYC